MTDSETGASGSRPGIGRRDLLKTVAGVSVGTAVAGVGSGTAAAATQTKIEWPTYRADAANTGFLPDAVGPQQTTGTDWSHSTGGWPTENLIVTPDTVFVGTRDGTVRALSRETGKERWRSTYEREVELVGRVGEYVVGQTSGTLFALSPADGSQQWRFDAESPFMNPSVTANGTVYTIGSRDTVVALDAATGDKQWQLSLGGNISTLLATGDTVVATVDGTIKAIDLSERRVRWTQPGSYITSTALTPETLFVAVPSGVRAYALESGDQQWRRDLSSPLRVLVADGDALYGGGLDGLVSLATADGSVRWRVAVSLPDGAISVGEGSVYFGSTTGNMAAVDTATGERRWGTTFAGPVVDTAIGADGDVYLGAGDGHVYRLESSDGVTQWRFETGGSVLSEPAVAGDLVYVGTRDSEVQALAQKDGTRRWQFDADGAVSTPTVGEETVYAATKAGTVYALDATDGSTKWTTSPLTPNASFESSPVLANGRLYVGNASMLNDALVYVFDPETGEQVDTITTDSSRTVTMTPAVAGTKAFVSSGGSLLAVDLESGDVASLVETTGFRMSPPVVVDGRVYVVGEGTLYAVDAESGTQQWTAPVQGISLVPPVVTGDTVYVHGAYGTTLHALSAADGAKKWTYTSERIFNPVAPVVTKNHVYAATADGLRAVARSTGEERWRTVGSHFYHGLAFGGGHLYTASTSGVRRLFEAEPPTAAFSFSPEKPTVGQEVTFDASDSADADGSIQQYRWDFDGDDELEAQGERQTYAYDTPGTYTVTLEVTDEQGLVATAERTVSVAESTPTPTSTETADKSTGTTTASDTLDTGNGTAAGESGPGFGVVSALLGVGLGTWRLLSRMDDD